MSPLAPTRPRDARGAYLLARRGWRYALARVRAPWVLRGCDVVGPNARVRGWPAVDNEGGFIRVGRNFCVHAELARAQLYAGPGAELLIGDDVFVNQGVVLSASARIVVGNRVLIGPGCTVIDNDFHGLVDRNDPPPSEPITIGDDVWLGTRCLVLRGVTIGAGAVVAAGAVVTQDVPPRTLVAGMPARVIRSL